MPHMWVDVDIALASVPVNLLPLVDSTDPSVIEDAVVYNQAGLALFWNFTTTTGVTTVTAVTPTTGDDHDWTDFTTSGMYGIEIPASGGDVNNDTEGFGHFTGVATGILPFAGPVIGFRAASVNDALVDSDTLIDDPDNALVYESAITTVTGQQEFIMTVPFAVDNSWIGCGCSLEDISTGEVYAGDQWISDSEQSTESLHINVVFPVTVVTGDKIRIYAGQHPAYALTTYGTAKTSEGTTNTNNILSKLTKFVQLLTRKDSAIASDLATEVLEINADEGSGGGGFDSTTDSLEAAQDDLTAAASEVTATKAKTDQLTFTKANELDANAKSNNDGEIFGAGTSGDLWRGSP